MYTSLRQTKASLALRHTHIWRYTIPPFLVQVDGKSLGILGNSMPLTATGSDCQWPAKP
jgi:hypothetical protein